MSSYIGRDPHSKSHSQVRVAGQGLGLQLFGGDAMLPTIRINGHFLPELRICCWGRWGRRKGGGAGDGEDASVARSQGAGESLNQILGKRPGDAGTFSVSQDTPGIASAVTHYYIHSDSLAKPHLPFCLCFAVFFRCSPEQNSTPPHPCPG